MVLDVVVMIPAQVRDVFDGCVLGSRGDFRQGVVELERGQPIGEVAVDYLGQSVSVVPAEHGGSIQNVAVVAVTQKRVGFIEILNRTRPRREGGALG